MQTITQLSRALSQAREQTDALFGLVRPDALYERPIPERHRIIFYLGHVEAFDWNLIARYALDKRPFQPEFDRLFAFGIDPPPGQLPCDRPADWPSLAEVQRYNQRVRDELDELLEEVPEQLLHVAIEHRLMHAETLAYILHQLAYEQQVGTAPRAAGGRVAEPRASMLTSPRALPAWGSPPAEGFGWDNEFERPRCGGARSSPSASTKSPTGSISTSFARARRLHSSGPIAAAGGCIAACSPEIPCRSTRRCM